MMGIKVCLVSSLIVVVEMDKINSDVVVKKLVVVVCFVLVIVSRVGKDSLKFKVWKHVLGFLKRLIFKVSIV